MTEKEIVDALLQTMRAGAEANLRRKDHLMPVIFIFGGIGGDIISPWIYESQEEKHVLLAKYKQIVEERHAKVVGIVSETWVVDDATEAERCAREGVPPRLSPMRREYAMAFIDTPKGGPGAYLAAITRTSPPGDEHGKFVSLGPWNTAPFAGGGLNFFPKMRARA